MNDHISFAVPIPLLSNGNQRGDLSDLDPSLPGPPFHALEYLQPRSH